LIVNASLVCNPANLGGLCRTAEFFRLSSLVIAHRGITKSPRFKELAASADHWQPLALCAPDALTTWIELQQASGYCVIALQQTLESLPLFTFQFPVQSTLVLGRELTGIPAEIVNVCDQRILIPQLGLVQSLNVQTAAAIAIYEYSRQHPL
jgi:tRNA guanosine-2'-O-methyltransferase